MKPFTVALLLALASSSARAQESGAPDDEPKADKDKAKDARADDELDIEGRVFVRSTLARADIDGSDDEPVLHDLSLASARLAADYRMGKRFKVVIEAELAGNEVDLKDVFIRARVVKDVQFIAGQFKKPISPIALESAWRLPLVERGLLGDLDSSSTAPDSSVPLPFGGRGIGAAVEVELDAPVGMQLVAAVFEHSIIDDDLIDLRDALPLDPYLRAVVEPVRETRFGATLALVTHRNRRPTGSQGIDHAPLGSVDAEVERGPVKVWAELFVGGSTVFDEPAFTAVAEGTMLGARALVALRLDDLAPWMQRLEPFLGGSYADPQLDADDSEAVQGQAGVALLLHDRFRLQVEAEITRVDEGTNRLRQGSRSVLYTQLGAVF